MLTFDRGVRVHKYVRSDEINESIRSVQTWRKRLAAGTLASKKLEPEDVLRITSSGSASARAAGDSPVAIESEPPCV